MLLMKNSMLKWMNTLWNLSKEKEALLFKKYFEQHESIYKCVASKDVEGAARAMKIHMDYVGERFISNSGE
jgi:DNA-binding FadR family transcriptional regulator